MESDNPELGKSAALRIDSIECQRVVVSIHGQKEGAPEMDVLQFTSPGFASESGAPATIYLLSEAFLINKIISEVDVFLKPEKPKGILSRIGGGIRKGVTNITNIFRRKPKKDEADE